MNTIPLPSRIKLLHERAVNASKLYHQAIGELMEALDLVEQNSVFLHYGCSSLFAYGVKYLGLSESVIYDMIGVLRKSRKVPELKAAVMSGELSVSKAIKLVSVITPTNQEELILKGKTQTSKEIEREVATLNPMKDEIRELAKYVSGNRLKLTLGISEEMMKRLNRVQDLVSGTKNKGATLEETIEEALLFYLKQKDPIEKAKRNNQLSQQTPPRGSFRTNEVGNQIAKQELEKVKIEVMGNHRVPIPTSIKHEVNQRDQGKCQFITQNKTKCESTRWTDLHHLKPVKEGGKNTA